MTARSDNHHARKLRQTRANMLGTDDEEHYWACHDAAAEIDRLEQLRVEDGEAMGLLIAGWGNMKMLCADGRYLSVVEQKALQAAIDAYALNNDDPDCAHIETTLRELLKRLQA